MVLKAQSPGLLRSLDLEPQTGLLLRVSLGFKVYGFHIKYRSIDRKMEQCNENWG